MNEKCKAFSEQLTAWRINHGVHNDGFHIQVQRFHNFYPSTGRYYNSQTKKNFIYKKFNNVSDFYEHLQNNQ